MIELICFNRHRQSLQFKVKSLLYLVRVVLLFHGVSIYCQACFKGEET